MWTKDRTPDFVTCSFLFLKYNVFCCSEGNDTEEGIPIFILVTVYIYLNCVGG